MSGPRRSRLAIFWDSSLGKKVVMGATGFVLVAFLVVHMAGNLQVFIGREVFNKYSELLRTSEELLWLARLGLLAAVVLHVVAAIQLTLRDRAARPVGYARQVPQVATLASRVMRIGGLLMYGIPNPKLDKKVVDRRVHLLSEEGIKFVTNTEVGKNYPAEKLLKDFDAVLLCCGATKPRDLPIEGRDLKGIHFAMAFLQANTKSLLDGKKSDDYISAEDKAVVVIGGGDSAVEEAIFLTKYGSKVYIVHALEPFTYTIDFAIDYQAHYKAMEAKAKNLLDMLLKINSHLSEFIAS